jgi:hypothetical protein
MRWEEHVARIEENRGVYRFLVWNPEGKGLHGRRRCRLEHKIKLNFQEVGLGAWIGLIWRGIATGYGIL